MNPVPPAVISSVLQSSLAQRQQSRTRSVEADSDAGAARELAVRDAQTDESVENTDADARVHADGGGQGGAGRSHDESPAGHEHADDAASAKGPTKPTGSPPHALDITA